MSERRYGYVLEQWEIAQAEMRSILIQRAREKRTITYGELSETITALDLPPYSYALSGMLTEISREDLAAGRGSLATLVVRKSDGRPGPGYFRGLPLPDDQWERYWQDQFDRVCKDWETS